MRYAIKVPTCLQPDECGVPSYGELPTWTGHSPSSLGVLALISAAIWSHFDFVLLAIIIESKTSEFCAHLWHTTLETPPAPITKAFAIFKTS